VLKEFERAYAGKPDVVVSAPGRIDFLNTHQDYKGLPVVGVAVNLRVYVAVSRRSDSKIRVSSWNLAIEGSEHIDSFTLDDIRLIGGKWFGDYIRAGVRVLEGMLPRAGFNMLIVSDIPIGSGLGSSGALLIASLGAISALYDLKLTTTDLAELAYIAEHHVMGIPCGRLDQYTSAFGGAVVINTKPPYNVERLPFTATFAVLDSGIKHSTAEIHPKRQEELSRALRQLLAMDIPESLRALLKPSYYETDWDRLTELEDLIDPYVKLLEPKLRDRILYTLRAHRSTLLALRILRGEFMDINSVAKELDLILRSSSLRRQIEGYDTRTLLGLIMVYQHMLLRDLYDVSLPKLDELVELSVEMGAYGAKLSGAGLGGAVIALVPSRDVGESIIREATRRGLAFRGWVVEVDEGLRVDVK